MAPRAAARLESLGFVRVYEYAAGKVDWLAAGLRGEGADTTSPVVADVTRVDVPRCKLDDPAGAIAQQLRTRGEEWGAVVNDAGILLGRVRLDQLIDPNAPVAAFIEEGPSTYRPNVPLQELLTRMVEGQFTNAFVSDPDGKLLGLITREDIEAVLENGQQPGIAASRGRSLEGGEKE